MSDSLNIEQQQQRAANIKEMDSMCDMVKGQLTYLDLTRRQWIDRILGCEPDTDVKELYEGDYHIVELGRACHADSDDDDLVSVSSGDEETEHEYKGNKYTSKQLFAVWEAEAAESKKAYKALEKANKSPAKKQKTNNPKSKKTDTTDKGDDTSADKGDDTCAKGKGAKAKMGTVWTRFIVSNRTVLGPTSYKKFCENVEREWEIPVRFTATDGSTVFKVLDVTKYDNKLRWAKNPKQDLAKEGEDYF